MNEPNPSCKRRLGAASVAAATLLLTLLGAAAVVPSVSAKVCIGAADLPCPLVGACSTTMATAADANAQVVVAITSTACAAASGCLEGETYSVTVTVYQMGPLDNVLGEVRCNGEHVAACTVKFQDVPTDDPLGPRSCSDASGLITASRWIARGRTSSATTA
jgi:hypothetical protein